jgi:hypothetical protein
MMTNAEFVNENALTYKELGEILAAHSGNQ